MKPISFMFIAVEPSGDLLAAELARALRPAVIETQSRPTADAQPLHTGLAPEFFGAGGPMMAAAGVELAFDLTQHAVIGLWEVLKHYAKFHRLFRQLLQLAIERQPDAILCVDFFGFNRRFAHAVKRHVRARRGPFYQWNPKIIQYVSPQVWASRPGRARAMAGDFELLLSIFPFEKAWYAQRVPDLKVEFVGHPLIDRYARMARGCPESRAPPANHTQPNSSSAAEASNVVGPEPQTPQVRTTACGISVDESEWKEGGQRLAAIVLLPGSRVGELRRHLPVLLQASRRLAASRKVSARLVLPNEQLASIVFWEFVRQLGIRPRLSGPPSLMDARAMASKWSPCVEVQVGALAEALSQATLALASTGTVTLECAYFGVPTVALYKTSWSTHQIAKRIIQVKYLAMPNLLANEAIFPEFIQDDATAENLAREALDLLNNPARREAIRAKLAKVIASLGPPGANQRAARAILSVL